MRSSAEPGNPVEPRYCRAEATAVSAVRGRMSGGPTGAASSNVPARAWLLRSRGSSRTTSKMPRSVGRSCSSRAAPVGARFRPHDQPARQRSPAGSDRGCSRLSLMRAAARELQDVGDVPDQLLGGCELLGRLDAPLELAEPLLARHQVGAAGLEHGPALAWRVVARAAAGTAVLPDAAARR